MKANDEPMALWFLSQIVISDLYNLKISFQCICMFSVSKSCTQRTYQHLFPSPLRFLEVRAGYRKETEKADYRDLKLNAQNTVKCMHNTQECVASSQKMHPLSFGPKWSFKVKQAAANFSLQRYRSVRQRQSPVNVSKHPRICGQRSKMAF